MHPDEAYVRLREACLRRPELRYKGEDIPSNLGAIATLRPYQGFCYVASNAFALVVPEATIWKDPEGRHYWNQVGGDTWDLTAEQFSYEFPYLLGVKTRAKLSNRVEELLKEADLWW